MHENNNNNNDDDFDDNNTIVLMRITRGKFIIILCATREIPWLRRDVQLVT